MDINNHITFRSTKEPELLEYLDANKIVFAETDGLVTFDIFRSDPHWQTVKHFVDDCDLFCLSESVFSEAERLKAQWLQIHSCWTMGYPQPEGNFKYETITYTRENHCIECGIGLKQVAPFRIKKQPRWASRHFMMLNWIADELFVDSKARKILENEAVSGISFREVMNKDGSEILPDTYQLVVNTVLKEGLVPEKSPLRDTLVCKECGMTRYHPHGIGKYTYRKEIFNHAPDIVKTAELFGWGHSSSREILIRQSVYRLLADAKLTRGLELSPVDLI